MKDKGWRMQAGERNKKGKVGKETYLPVAPAAYFL